MKRLGSILLGACVLISSAKAQPQEASWLEQLHLAAAGTVSTVNNLSRTSHPPSRKDATTWELSLASRHARQLAPSLLLTATAEVASLIVPEFDQTNHHRFSGRLALQHKFGLGPQATVLELGAGAGYKDARLRADRGWSSEIGVQLSKRVLSNLRLSAGGKWLEHAARSAVFDLHQSSYTLDLHWDIDDRWTFSVSGGRLEGDIVANASWPIWGTMLAGGFGPAIFDYYTSRPWSTTHLYGPGWVSYNVEADVDLWSAAFSYALSEQTSLEIRKSAAYVVNRVGVTYPTDSWSLGLAHRF